jgi:hypothetical protein
MADTDAPDAGRPADQVARQALLRWLARAHDDARAPATWLDKIVRAHLDKAVAGDLSAIKEIYDRADGKPSSAVAAAEQRPAPRVLRWMD